MNWKLLTPEYPPHVGGVASWSRSVAALLEAKGQSVEVIARRPRQGGGDPADRDVRWIVGRSWRRWQGVWSAWAARSRGDAVALCATWPMAVHLGSPLLVAYHGSDLTRPAPIAGLDEVKRRAANLPVSRFLGRLLDAPHRVLPYPIAPLAPVPRGDALLVVARLIPEKGVDTALRFAARLGRPIRVVGDGPERPRLEALARELRLDATFCGAVPASAIPWEGAWALALFSRGDEGLGLVLLEAAARGIPSFGSRAGGIPEAATVTLDDPLHDDVPEPPGTSRDALAESHGPERTWAVLRASLDAIH